MSDMPWLIHGATVTVHEDDDGLWAEVPALPGCFAAADSLDELRVSVEEAIALWLAEERAVDEWVKAKEKEQSA